MFLAATVSDFEELANTAAKIGTEVYDCLIHFEFMPVGGSLKRLHYKFKMGFWTMVGSESVAHRTKARIDT